MKYGLFGKDIFEELIKKWSQNLGN